MDDETHVEFHEWGDEPFDVAQRAAKPVLLSLTATWCTHCAEMDERTYSEPRIAANINDGFVPIRVDVDRQPRVRNRYSMGGVPSTVLLTPSGEVLSGAGYLGPDGMRQVIDGVRKRWDQSGESAGSVPRSLQNNPTPSGDLTDDIEAALYGQLQNAYDAEAGGWGTQEKYPMPRTIEFALTRDREMALRSLNAVSANLLDDYAGGFFRHARNADWSNPAYEKVLDTNAALVRAFSNAYLLTGSPEYREPAHKTIEYLTTTLWVDDPPADGPGAFAASQAPGDGAAYYTQDPSDRDDSDPPSVDRTLLADWNALAVESLLTYHSYTDDDRARRYATQALQTLLSGFIDDGRVVHYRDPDGQDGEAGLLVDHARLIQACCTARQVLGPTVVGADLVSTAVTLAEYGLDELRPDGVSFVDGPASGPGLLDRPFRPLDGNVAFAEALLDLAALSGEQRYAAAAQSALEAFADAADRFGPQVAGYGDAVGRVLSPELRIELTANAGSDLHRAALRVADPNAVVVPDADAGDVRTAVTESANSTVADQQTDGQHAVVFIDDEPGTPVTTPATLSDQVERRLDEL